MEHHGSSIKPHHRLFGLLRMERNDLWVAITFSLAIGLLSLVVPVATQALVNTIAFGTLLQPLLILSLVVLGILAISSVLQVMRYSVVEMLQRRVFVSIASNAVNRLLRSRVDALRLCNGPELVNRFLDIVTVQKAGATLLVDGLSVLMQTLIGMVLLGVYHPWLLAFDAVLLAALLVVVFPVGAGAVRTAIEESKAKYALVAWLEEVARNSMTFRSESSMRWAFARTNELVTSYLEFRGKHFRILMRQFAGSLTLQSIASAVLLGVGGLLVIQRQLTLGQLVAAELVVNAVLQGISKLAKHLETFYDLLASLDKLGTLTDIPVEQHGEELLPGPDGPARVYVRTPDFAMEIAPAEKIGIWGSSGSGKSALMDALCGYAEVPHTAVEVNGLDIRSLQRGDLRANVELVRGVEIFHGTIFENVRVGRENVSLAAAQKALDQVGIWDAIQSLPEGINTMLYTGGAPLSEGQRQALMIARAIAAKPRLLILDEAIDTVQDNDERELLTEILFDRNAPWTLIVVTAREDLLKRCERVMHVTRKGLREAA